MLVAKATALAVGALLFILGLLTGRRSLVLAAIAVLAIGVVIRIATHRAPVRHATWDDPPGDEADG